MKKATHTELPVQIPYIGPSIFWGVILFLVTCISTSEMVTISILKATMIPVLLLTIAGCFLFRHWVGPRFSPIGIYLLSWLIIGWLSGFYARSAQFALNELIKLVAAFCVFLLILMGREMGERGARRVASMVSVSTALFGFFSIDLISTRIFSGLLQGLFGDKLLRIAQASGLEEGVRITSILGMPNVFAGCLGLGVLLSLGLVAAAESEKERNFHRTLLYINALAFVLAFSMGASGTIVLAFVVYLILVGKSRMSQLVLMVETLVLTMVAVFPIYITSFTKWDGIQPIPLLCAVVGALALSALDEMVGVRLSTLLNANPKVAKMAVGGTVLFACVFALLSVNLTGSATLSAGDNLRRASYPQAGNYSLSVESSGAVNVRIESQDKEDTMMHTSQLLYSGDVADASFVVPEGSLVVYYDFSASEDAEITSASVVGQETEESLKLDYILLPGFIANRLQGLFANENAIQRTVFFQDGMKLFSLSPLIGLGLGSFENAILGVQDFLYETKYVHNHYIQMLLDMGIIGFSVFVGVLSFSLLALWKSWRRENPSPMVAALASCVIFMAAHGAVELTFSSAEYLIPAFAVFAAVVRLSGWEIPFATAKNAKFLHSYVIGMTMIFLMAFTAMLTLNVYCYRTVTSSQPEHYFDNVQQAATLDYYGHANYWMSYVHGATSSQDPEIIEQATVYAQLLAGENSNTSALYVAKFYFSQGEIDLGYEMLEKHATYTASDSNRWNQVFQVALENVTEENFSDSLPHIQHLYDNMVTWQEGHMGELTLDDAIQTALESLQVI